jgi:hypothetical protein
MQEWTVSIEKFWQTFSEIRDDLSSSNPKKSSIDRLNDEFSALGIYSWEIGPFDNDGVVTCLTVSPDRYSGNKEVVRKIISSFPGFVGWTVREYRLPKKWKRKFKWRKSNELIDASAWDASFKVLKEQLKFDVLVRMEPEYISRSDSIDLAQIFIEAELGEEFLVEFVRDIKMVEGNLREGDGYDVVLKELKPKWFRSKGFVGFL